MEDLWNKIGVIIAAIISAFCGLYVHDRKTTNDRLSNVEQQLSRHETDIQVIETKFSDLKEDTAEIKETQKTILALLTSNRRK